MGRHARLHDHYCMVTLFDWQHQLIIDDLGHGKYKNRRDALEDFLLEHYAPRSGKAAEYLASKKEARRLISKTRKAA